MRGIFLAAVLLTECSHEVPMIHESMLGSVSLTRCQREMSNGSIRIWLYAYILPRQPSLTFLTIRGNADAARLIETYLMSVRLR